MASSAFRQTVTISWPKHQEAGAKARLIKLAREGHAETLQEQTTRFGVKPDSVGYANRVGQTDISAVILPGPIVFRYFYFREIAAVGLRALQEASPVRSGDYARGHTLFLNGAPVDVLPANLKATDVVMIANPVPYARRIEVGKTKAGRSFVVQVADHIYERVAKKVLAPRYRNAAKIEFTYINLGAGSGKGKMTSHYLSKGNQRGGSSAPLRLRKRDQSASRRVIMAPAIIIRAL